MSWFSLIDTTLIPPKMMSYMPFYHIKNQHNQGSIQMINITFKATLNKSPHIFHIVLAIFYYNLAGTVLKVILLNY